jgi:hypothetical protein
VLGFPVALVSYRRRGGRLKGALLCASSFRCTRAPVPHHGAAPDWRLIVPRTFSGPGCSLAVTSAVMPAALGLAGSASSCLTLLIPDHASSTFGVTDMGAQTRSRCRSSCSSSACAHAERPRWRTAVVVALVVFVGPWTRIDFGWFVGAADRRLPRRRPSAFDASPRSRARGLRVGLAMLAPIVRRASSTRPRDCRSGSPSRDLARLQRHLLDLLLLPIRGGRIAGRLTSACTSSMRRTSAGVGSTRARRPGARGSRRAGRSQAPSCLRRPRGVPGAGPGGGRRDEQSYEVHQITNLSRCSTSPPPSWLPRWHEWRRAHGPGAGGLGRSRASGALWVQTRAFADLTTAPRRRAASTGA